MLVQHKKGVSEMIAYVLLVVIAIGLSVAVYSFLSAYVPKNAPECKEGVNLVTKDVSCIIDSGDNSVEVSVTYSNKGLFSVDGSYARMEKEGRRVKKSIFDDSGNDQNFFFPAEGLKPGEEFTVKYDATQSNVVEVSNLAQVYELQIQPAVDDPKTGRTAACSNIIINQKVTCTLGGSPSTMYSVTVATDPTGANAGHVISSPVNSIDCTFPDPTCSALFPLNTNTVLTATSTALGEFESWTSCPGTINGNDCTVNVASNVIAKFRSPGLDVIGFNGPASPPPINSMTIGDITWTGLPDYSGATVSNINHPEDEAPVNAVWPGRYHNWGKQFTGYLNIPQTGNWELYLESDDGSALWIDTNPGSTASPSSLCTGSSSPLVDNDDEQSMNEESNIINNLAAGKYPVCIRWFDAPSDSPNYNNPNTEDYGMIVSWRGPSQPKTIIPSYTALGGGFSRN